MSARVPRRKPAAPSRVIDGAAVVIQTRLAEVTMLDEVGTRVWSAIDGRRSEGEIVALVAGEFEVTPEKAAEDVRVFLDDLCSAELIELASGPPRERPGDPDPGNPPPEGELQ